ncbi:MAG TPA: YihY/virulence factor BrkB family protein [Nocardioidaceae bacterium]|jgi:membrane protein|nr:YihY/virulence factor BrkB family protein [Nocardioidaceae bacterium]
MAGESGSAAAPELSRWQVIRDTAWRLIVSTVGTCMRNRVTGLAAEAAFFALLSLPPLIFALAGSIGYVFSRFNEAQLDEIRESVVDLSLQALTEDTVNSIIVPTLNDVFRGARYDVISIGFVLALWSGSRALNVFVDTITIMYGLGGHRGIVKTRVLSFFLYVMGLITGVITIPLVLAGPTLVDKVIPARLDFLNSLYWPVVVVLCICFLATLYHVSVPVRTSWRYNLPGATLTLLLWVFGSFLLRWVLTTTAGESTSIYGPLAAPIAVLLWLYLLSIAVLIGAAVNAAFDRVWPESETARARMELVRKLRLKAMLPRLRRDEEEHARFPDAASETIELSVYDEGADHDREVDSLDPVRSARRTPRRRD